MAHGADGAHRLDAHDGVHLGLPAAVRGHPEHPLHVGLVFLAEQAGEHADAQHTRRRALQVQVGPCRLGHLAPHPLDGGPGLLAVAPVGQPGVVDVQQEQQLVDRQPHLPVERGEGQLEPLGVVAVVEGQPLVPRLLQRGRLLRREPHGGVQQPGQPAVSPAGFLLGRAGLSAVSERVL